MSRQKKMAKPWSRRYSDSLRAADPDVLTPMRARDFLFLAPVETGLGAHPVSCNLGCSPGLSVQGVALITHPL